MTKLRYLALAAAVMLLPVAAPAPAQAAARPNIVVFMTDDQSISTLWVMNSVRTLLTQQGLTYANNFVSYSLCCPSRATYLTGQYPHNHGVMSNSPPDGGYYKLRGGETLPVWLSRAGYQTAH